MAICKNCGEVIGYHNSYFFTKRKIYVHIIQPYWTIGKWVISFFNYAITDKCNKPEPIEEVGKIGQ